MLKLCLDQFAQYLKSKLVSQGVTLINLQAVARQLTGIRGQHIVRQQTCESVAGIFTLQFYLDEKGKDLTWLQQPHQGINSFVRSWNVDDSFKGQNLIDGQTDTL